ncbi:unnamed protein product [Rotaria socialis]|uniref:G-protein coupled receptors family 1 profile domain-containing protein n=1 Tax=Rotaria socialis TaxID=392032 RepID=A0A817VYA6_9BILA|nr:unnamed protein product [Rotaria socialis]CAF4720220.1 unnamed protein product [Rotaria socialis]
MNNTNDKLSYTHVNLTRWVSSTIAPIILLGCAIGNIVSFFVLLRPRLRKETTSIYLAVLCVAEMGTCYTGLLRQFLIDAFSLDIRSINGFSCRIHIYFTYVFLRLAPLILALVTLQRYLFVGQLALCSLKQTIIQLCSCTLFVFVAEFHLFIFYDFTHSDTRPRNQSPLECTVDTLRHGKYYTFRSKIYPKLSLVLYTIIPLAIIIIGNALLIRKVREASKRSRSKTNKKRSITRMLYAVSILYTVLTSPAAIFLALAPQINFLLFCASGSTFRQELVGFLKTISCCCQLNCTDRKVKHNEVKLNNRVRFIPDTTRNNAEQNQKLSTSKLADNSSGVL